MYYDPMISKLITTADDRKTAMELLDGAFDEYVIQGLAHNLGFGKSIIHNEAFAAGDYSTAFIDTYYPDGYSGDVLTQTDRSKLALAAHFLKNAALKNNEPSHAPKSLESVIYVSIVGKGEEKDRDVKVERIDVATQTIFKVTDLESGASEEFTMADIDFEHNALLRLTEADNSKTTI